MSDAGELIPEGMTKREIREEAHYRAHKAGYDVTRNGKPRPLQIMTTCPVGRTKFNLWPRDEHGNLVE